MIFSCNVYELESKTGIIPRDSWHTKARRGVIYYIKVNNKNIAFLYLKNAKQYIKSNYNK